MSRTIPPSSPAANNFSPPTSPHHSPPTSPRGHGVSPPTSPVYSSQTSEGDNSSPCSSSPKVRKRKHVSFSSCFDIFAFLTSCHLIPLFLLLQMCRTTIQRKRSRLEEVDESEESNTSDTEQMETTEHQFENEGGSIEDT